MNTMHLKYAVEVERTRSITQAAENLYMAQPNLSKAIKELEDTLGIAIFSRTSRGAIPTAKGAEFLAYAKIMLEQLEKMESLSMPENADRQVFNVSIPRGSYIASGFTMFVAGLDMEKEILVNIKETNSMQTIRNVAEGRFDLGIIRYQTSYENYFVDFLAEKSLRYEPIWEFDYLVVMSKDHPLAAADRVKSEDLEDYVELLHGDTSIPYLQNDEIKKPDDTAHGKKRIYVYDRCSQFDMLSHIPQTYMWVSPIPHEWLERYGLVQRRCPVPNHKYKDILILRKGYSLTELDKRFVDELFRSKSDVAFREYE